ncbi:hypothetical protein [Nocardiopsis oceani]
MTGASAFWGLTRFNVRHLLTSPVFLLVVPVSLVGLSLSTRSSELPSWVGLHGQATVQALGLAAVMYVATTFPAIREVRHSEGFALPLSARGRLTSLALASSAVTAALMAALSAVPVLDAAGSATGSIAGTVSPLALLGVVVLSCCGPTAAVAATAWTRSYAPLVTLVLFLPAYFLYTLTAMGTRADDVLRQLGTVVGWVLNPIPVNHPAVTKVALLHLAHAVLLAGLLLALALSARNGVRSLRPLPMGVAGLLLAGVLGVSAYGGNTYSYDTHFTDEQLRAYEADPCRVREGVAYCPLPGYESWVDYWHAALGPAMAQIPDEERDGLPSVWQSGRITRVDIHPRPPEDAVTVSERWDPDQPFYREDLVNSATATVLGLAADPEYACSNSGQARIVVGAWMASVDPHLSDAESLEAADAFLARFGPTESDVRLAHGIADLPEEHVSSVVDEHWDTLVSPGTESEELADLLGLSLHGEEALPEPDWEQTSWTQESRADDLTWGTQLCS